jgi:hypothetical protein
MAFYTNKLLMQTIAGATAVGSAGYTLKYFVDEHAKEKTKEFNNLTERYNNACKQLEHMCKDAALNNTEAQNKITTLEVAIKNSKEIIAEKQARIDKLEESMINMNKDTDTDFIDMAALMAMAGCVTLLGITYITKPVNL